MQAFISTSSDAEMYRTAGARLIFDAGPIGELVELVEAQIDRILSELAAAA